MRVLEPFCCGGGASVGMALLGMDVIGVDHDPDACATHTAAGHRTIRADLSQPFTPPDGPFDGVWASPPCTAFSMAGHGRGRERAPDVVAAIDAQDWRSWHGPADPPEVWLVLPTMRLILETAPRWVAMENVPQTRPVMEACARVLERHGWRCRVLELSAEQFGVAQTRKRCFLMARRDGMPDAPEPTHQRYVFGQPARPESTLFGERLPWVSMAEALGWGTPDRPYFTLASAGESFDTTGGGSGARASLHKLASSPTWVARAMRGAGMDDRHGSRPDRPITEPAPTVRANGGSNASPGWQWVLDRRTNSRAAGGGMEPTVPVPIDCPAPTITGKGASGQMVFRRLNPGATRSQPNRRPRGTDAPAPTVGFGNDAASWCWERPATTVNGDPRLSDPGHHDPAQSDSQYGEDTVRLTIGEAARLQAFPPDHPWRGTKTSQFRQVGNAVPPPMAAVVAACAAGQPWREAVAGYLAGLYGAPVSYSDDEIAERRSAA